MIFNFYTDPSHGWLKVKRSLVEKLGLIDSISVYSYQKGPWVYLEEDCDATKFDLAMKERGIKYSVKHNHTNNSSGVRRMESFRK
jgi:hypothetical protein